MQKNLPPAWVHPRSRGEYLSPVFLNLLISGSSPLTRGILLHAVEISRSCRFTPAHAGNTESVPAMFLQAQVHPRSRGEYFGLIDFILIGSGSPPLTRGIPVQKKGEIMRDRFTPAHAGNTPDCRGRHLRIEVHPRSRGEYRISVAACFQSSGSPPLTRGIRSFSNPLFQVARFTPAHPGNTSVQLSKLICNQVHPRSRGEYSNVSGVSIPNSGSPPLTRGILSPNTQGFSEL